jgi:hypothetical protein
MNYESITEQLLGLLEEHGVQIRKDAMGGGGGGLCRLKDKDLMMIDCDSSSLETAAACARAVHAVIQDMDGIYLRPVIREFIDKYAADG